MGPLMDRLKLSQKVFGTDIVDYYKKNTQYMFELYKKSSKECEVMRKEDIKVGGFYHLVYRDDSNWMRWSPIFCCDYRKMGNMIIVLGVNFNFIPLELRPKIFDPFIREEDFEKNKLLEVDFKGMYTELLKIGFEYSIQEYNVAQIDIIHRINLDILPRFMYSSFPKNKYDPNKLMDTWEKKLETKAQRHREIIQSVLSDFYDVENDINERYDALSGHIQRLQKSYTKYGRP